MEDMFPWKLLVLNYAETISFRELKLSLQFINVYSMNKANLLLFKSNKKKTLRTKTDQDWQVLGWGEDFITKGHKRILKCERAVLLFVH